MNKISGFFFRAWRPALLVMVLAAAIYYVFFHKLATLLPGYAPREVAAFNSVANFHLILNNPLNAPYKLLAYFGLWLKPNHLAVMRVAAASYGVMAGLLYFWIVRRWFTYRVALLSTILFTTSAALMHVSRFGTPIILQSASLLLLATSMWFVTTKHRALGFYVGVIVFASLLYVPGMVWFEAFGMVFWRLIIGKELRSVPSFHKATAAILGFLMITPLIRAFAMAPKQLLTFAGLPQSLPTTHEVITNLTHVLLGVGIHSDGTPELWLGHAPRLDIIQLALLILGIYSYTRYARLTRSTFILVGSLVGIILATLGGPILFIALVPFLYLLIAGGLYELLHQWLAVFPRNPIARFTGIGIVCVLVFFSVFYQWREYFIAWPYNNQTKAVFNIKHE